MKKKSTIILLMLFSMLSLFSQQTPVNGRVVDENNEALPGVSVLIRGSTTGTVTDVNGNYQINVPGPESVLLFSFVGYVPQEIAVGNQNVININLIPDIASLAEVVVIGYGTALKKDVTTAIASVSTDEIPKAANSNINDLLFGRAAGLQVVQKSGQPGGEIDLRIRGRQENPLIVIDGIVMPKYSLEPGINFAEIDGVQRNGLGGLNPNDIESIEILKDASAAIYGIGASDGVVLITTKKGRSEKIQVSYSGNYSYVQNLPYLQQLTAKEYMEYYNQFEGDLYNFKRDMEPFGTNPSNYIPEYRQGLIDSAGTGTDWVGQILKDGQIINQNINISGGTDKITYYFSANYFDQEGTVKNSGLTKYNTRLNLSYAINNRLTFKANTIIGKNKYLNNGSAWQTGNAGSDAFRALQSAYSYPATLPVRDEDGKYTRYTSIGNPIAQLEITDNTAYSSVLADFALDVDIVPKILKTSFTYGTNSEDAYREFYLPSYVFFFNEERARASLNNSKRNLNTFEVVTSFNKKFRNINFSAIAGYGEYFEQLKTMGLQAQDMLDAINFTNVASGTAVPNVTSGLEKNRKRSYFTRATIDFLDRYIITGAIRYDGFSYFFPESKYASFPSVSVGWKLNNEPFLSSISSIDLLKIRASYGVTGRVSNGAIAYGGFQPDDVLIPFNGAATKYSAYYINRIDNPDLTWEKTIMMNAGFDFAFMNNRFTGAFDIFRDDITNLLDENAPTEALSFLVSAPQNGGHQVRSGWDFGLDFDVLRTKDLFWSTFVNLSHFKFRWEERFEHATVFSYEDVKGPVNAIYAYETDGILQIADTGSYSAWQPVNAQMPGAPRFVDKNGDQVLDSADVVLYDPTPKFSIGWGNTFKYKAFDLTIQLYGQFGSYRYNPLIGWVTPQGILSNIAGTKDYKDVWSSSNPDGIYPGSTYNESNLAELTSSDVFISKADFVRVRNITLGYTQNFKNNINSARIYVDIQNAFLFTKYPIGDPEVDARGVKGAPAPYPMTRVYSFGLNINF